MTGQCRETDHRGFTGHKKQGPLQGGRLGHGLKGEQAFARQRGTARGAKAGSGDGLGSRTERETARPAERREERWTGQTRALPTGQKVSRQKV